MKNTLFIVVLFIIPVMMYAQKKAEIISGYGETFEVSNPDFKTDTHNSLKVVFDVGRTFEDSTSINPLFNTAARYVNMHVNAGVPAKNINVALVVHGDAITDILSNNRYQEKYGIDNPNATLINALSGAGVQVILCGQTTAYRGVSKKDILPETHIALSAMTALVQLQNGNYRLINF
ncbi:DsrE family protein [Aquimarina sp. U1-2]|uniref:DsrE family protein n=1 Tax=Aquimarina sp. U1-2 TaxID=2823141 RepID=UPI001AED1177|nr:DsrE family protein [Aquimarina sp. U1-2]MBP2832769.1 DsrE family protein [Aquimarina sp. U1-2]